MWRFEPWWLRRLGKAPNAYFRGRPRGRLLLETRPRRAGQPGPAKPTPAHANKCKKMNVGVDDILAALIMSLIMLRRLETLAVQQSNNPGVSPENFAKWRALALSGYNLGAIACLAKVVLNIGWFLLVRDYQNPGRCALAVCHFSSRG